MKIYVWFFPCRGFHYVVPANIFAFCWLFCLSSVLNIFLSKLDLFLWLGLVRLEWCCDSEARAQQTWPLSSASSDSHFVDLEWESSMVFSKQGVEERQNALSRWRALKCPKAVTLLFHQVAGWAIRHDLDVVLTCQRGWLDMLCLYWRSQQSPKETVVLSVHQWEEKSPRCY